MKKSGQTLANKLGGVHYDSKGRNSDLDYLRSQVRLLERDPLFLTVLGMGQAIVHSEDIISLGGIHLSGPND
jgi:hypothetical protein